MATVPVQVVAVAGTQATYAAATAGGGDKIVPGDGVFVHVKNGSGGSITLTLVTPGEVDGLAVADRTVVVPAGEDRFASVGDLYRNRSDGLATLTWSAVTTVTFAALRL
jgi:hypothetical protein